MSEIGNKLYISSRSMANVPKRCTKRTSVTAHTSRTLFKISSSLIGFLTRNSAHLDVFESRNDSWIPQKINDMNPSTRLQGEMALPTTSLYVSLCASEGLSFEMVKTDAPDDILILPQKSLLNEESALPRTIEVAPVHDKPPVQFEHGLAECPRANVEDVIADEMNVDVKDLVAEELYTLIEDWLENIYASLCETRKAAIHLSYISLLSR